MTIKAHLDRYLPSNTGPWPSSLARRLPNMVIWLLVLMLAWLAVRLLWLLLSGPSVSLATTLPMTQPVGPNTSIEQTEHGNAIWSAIFDSAGRSFGNDFERLPLDQSALTLVGVVAWSDGQDTGASQANSYVIIRPSGGVDRVYRLNETLEDGRRIEAIERDRVVLSANGRQEVLMLEQRDRQPRRTGMTMSDSLPSGPQEPLPTGIGVASIGALGQQWALGGSRGRVDQGPLMVVPSGGYRLRPGPDAQWFVAAGLQVGDVLLAVNGQPLDAAVDGQMFDQGWIERLSQGDSIVLTVQRQDATFTVQPSLSELRRALNQRMRSQ